MTDVYHTRVMLIQMSSGNTTYIECLSCDSDPNLDMEKTVPVFTDERHIVDFGWRWSRLPELCSKEFKSGVWVCPNCARKFVMEEAL